MQNLRGHIDIEETKLLTFTQDKDRISFADKVPTPISYHNLLLKPQLLTTMNAYWIRSKNIKD